MWDLNFISKCEYICKFKIEDFIEDVVTRKYVNEAKLVMKTITIEADELSQKTDDLSFIPPSHPSSVEQIFIE